MEKYEKRGYLQENFRLFHLRSQGGANVGPHYHEFCKLLLLQSGQGSYYIDGQHFLLIPGDILFIGSHSVHAPELSPELPYERIIIYVSPEFLRRVSTESCDLTGLFSPGGVLRPRESSRKLLFGLAQELERELSQEGFGREVLSQANLTRLLVALGRCREERDTQAPSPNMPENRRILEIMAYLDENLTEEVDIDHLAETFFVSKYHMMRSFRAQTGTTIGSYLTRRRLLLARQRMEEGLSATESCFSSGFKTYSSFTRAYRKHFGTTPTGRPDSRLIREEDYE